MVPAILHSGHLGKSPVETSVGSEPVTKPERMNGKASRTE